MSQSDESMTAHHTRTRTIRLPPRRVLYVCAVLLAAIALPSVPAARCLGLNADAWRTEDKREHLLGGTLVAWVVGVQTRDPWVGFGWGAVAAVGTEVLAAIGDTGVCSAKDALAGLAGAAIGASLGGLYLRHGGGQTQIVYAMRW